MTPEQKVKMFVENHTHKNFRYGKHDCVTFGMKAFKDIWGKTIFLPDGITWSNKTSAIRAILSVSKSLLSCVRVVATQNQLIAVQKPNLMAGDVVVVEALGDVGLGVMENCSDAVVLNRVGLLRISRDQVLEGWRA